MENYLYKGSVPRLENPPPPPPRKLNLSEAEILLVTELASYFFTPREIAVMVEIHPDDAIAAMQKNDSSFYIAFQKGRLQNEMELRRSIIKLAKAGSSPAQAMSLDLLNKSRIKMLER